MRVIVPFAPGGPTDVFARLMSQKLSEQTGKQFYVENVGGAGGNTGHGRAAQAAPDGYTILVTGGSHLNNPFLYSHVPYDPIKDFDPVTLAVDSAVVLTVHPCRAQRGTAPRSTPACRLGRRGFRRHLLLGRRPPVISLCFRL